MEIYDGNVNIQEKHQTSGLDRPAGFPLNFPQGPVELWLEYRGRGSIDVLTLEFE